MLKGFGITHPGAQQTARAALAEAGVISRPDRTNLADYKCPRHMTPFQKRSSGIAAVGTAAKRRLPALSRLILVQKRCCRICGGSSERAALIDLAGEMAAARISRVLVVGGTEAKSREILEASPPKIEWRFVDGADSPTRTLLP